MAEFFPPPNRDPARCRTTSSSKPLPLRFDGCVMPFCPSIAVRYGSSAMEQRRAMALVDLGNRLVCVASEYADEYLDGSADAAAVQDHRRNIADLYNQLDAELQDAWRGGK